MVTPTARREAVAHLRASLGVSERRACVNGDWTVRKSGGVIFPNS